MTAIDNNVVLEHVLTDDAVDFEITPAIHSLVKAMGSNRTILTSVYRSLLAREGSFKIKPLFGAEYLFTFDYAVGNVVITQSESNIDLSIEQLRLLLGKVDAATSPIYPLGSVLKLNDGMFPDHALDMAQISDESHGLVIVTGRKLQLIDPYQKYIVDYIVSIWPLGEQIGQEQPFIVSNMMIDSVVAKGYSNSDEKEVADVLHAGQLEAQQVSTAFMTAEDTDKFVEQLTIKNQK